MKMIRFGKININNYFLDKNSYYNFDLSPPSSGPLLSKIQ